MIDFLAALDSVVQRLEALGLAASIDPAKVNVPGVFVDLTGTRDLGVLSGEWGIGCELVLIVKANERPEALEGLQALVNEVIAEFGDPDGEVRKQATVLPSSPVGLPSLVLPYVIT